MQEKKAGNERQVEGNADKKNAVMGLGVLAKKAAAQMALLSTDEKNRILMKMAEALRINTDEILEKNALDVAASKEKGMSAAFVDRLTLTTGRLEDMAKGWKTWRD